MTLFTGAFEDRVVDVGADGDGQVGREGPRRRRPHEQLLAGLQLEADGQLPDPAGPW